MRYNDLGDSHGYWFCKGPTCVKFCRKPFMMTYPGGERKMIKNKLKREMSDSRKLNYSYLELPEKFFTIQDHFE